MSKVVELVPTEIKQLLQEPVEIRLGTTGFKDESPHVIPLWFCCSDEVMYMTVNQSSKTARNLAVDKNVVVTLGHGKKRVIINGVAEVGIDEAGLWKKRISERYLDEQSVEKRMAKQEEDDLLISVPIRNEDLIGFSLPK